MKNKSEGGRIGVTRWKLVTCAKKEWRIVAGKKADSAGQSGQDPTGIEIETRENEINATIVGRRGGTTSRVGKQAVKLRIHKLHRREKSVLLSV